MCIRDRTDVVNVKLKEPVMQMVSTGTKTIAPSGNFMWPVAGGYVSSEFGWRTLRGQPSYHRAVDIAANSLSLIHIYISSIFSFENKLKKITHFKLNLRYNIYMN